MIALLYLLIPTIVVDYIASVLTEKTLIRCPKSLLRRARELDAAMAVLVVTILN